MLTPSAHQEEGVTDRLLKESLAFMRSAPAYASDEALMAFMRFRMGVATQPPPPVPIMLRLVNDFMLAVPA